MKKFIRVLLILGGVVLLLTGAAALLIRIYLTPEKVKLLVQEQLESRLDRQVELGSISVGLLSGVRVDDFKISERPDFTAGTFLSSDRFAVHIAWPALLAKKVLISNLELIKPRVTLIRNADGTTYNFSDLASPSDAPAAAPSDSSSQPKKSGLDILVAKASLTDGNLSFLDRSTAAASIDIDRLNLAVRNIGLSAPLDVQGSCRIQTKGRHVDVELEADAAMSGDTVVRQARVSSGASEANITGKLSNLFGDTPASLDLTLDIPAVEADLLVALEALPANYKALPPLKARLQVQGSPENLSIQNLKVSLDRLLIEGDGRFEQPAAGPRTFGLRLSTNEFDPKALLAYIPSVSLPKDLSLAGTLSANLAYTGTADKGELTLKLNGQNIDVRYGDSFQKAAGIPAALEMKGSYRAPNSVEAKTFGLKLGGLSLNGSGTYAANATQINLSGASVPLADLERLLPGLRPYDLSGTGAIRLRYAERGKKPATYDLSAALQNASATVEQARVTKLTASLSASPDEIRVPHFAGLLDGANFQGLLTLTGLETKPSLKVEFKADAVDLAKLIPKEETPSEKKAGKNQTAPPPVVGPPGLLGKALNTTGRISVDKLSHDYFTAQKANLTWSLSGVTPELDRVAGSATLRAGAGGLTKNVQNGRSPVGKILLTPITLLQKIGKVAGGAARVPSFENIRFHEVLGDYKAQNGMLAVERFDLNGTDAQVQMTGTAGLAGTQPLNLKLVIRGKSDSTAIHLKVGGSLPDPKVGLDVAAQGKQALESITTEPVKDILEGIFKR